MLSMTIRLVGVAANVDINDASNVDSIAGVGAVDAVGVCVL